MVNGIKSHGKNLVSYYYSNYYDVSVNELGVKCKISLRFWENKGWINSIDPYGWFQLYFRYWLGRRPSDDERQIDRWKGIVSRFTEKIINIIKHANVELMIILVHLKLDKFYCLGVIN